MTVSEKKVKEKALNFVCVNYLFVICIEYCYLLTNIIYMHFSFLFYFEFINIKLEK